MIPRRSLPFVICSAAFVFVCFSGMTALTKNGPRASESVDKANFKGKILWVRERDQQSVFIAEARLRKVADRVWLVGKGADVGPAGVWQKGRTVWIAWDRVDGMIEFDRGEEIKKLLEEEAKSLPPPVEKNK